MDDRERTIRRNGGAAFCGGEFIRYAGRRPADFGVLTGGAVALGMKTSLQKLALVGWRPIVMLVGETLFLAALVIGLLCLGR